MVDPDVVELRDIHGIVACRLSVYTSGWIICSVIGKSVVVRTSGSITVYTSRYA